MSGIRFLFVIGMFVLLVISFTYILVAPWFFILVLAGTLFLFYHEQIVRLIARIAAKLGRKKAPPKPPEEIKIPEEMPQSIPLPEGIEHAKPTPELVRQLVEAVKSANETIRQSQVQIAELRAQLDRLKEERDAAIEELNQYRGFLSSEQLEEFFKTLLASSVIAGVPVVDKRGLVRGTAVGIVPHPHSGAITLLVRDAYGVIRPAGWGLTWADPNYYPLIDPECWRGIVEELNTLRTRVDFSKGYLEWAMGKIQEHGLVLSEWATNAPQYIDAFATRERGEGPIVVVKDGTDAARIIQQQRDEIEQLKKALNRLYDELDQKDRQISVLKEGISLLLTELQSLNITHLGSMQALYSALRSLEVDSSRADLAQAFREISEFNQRQALDFSRKVAAEVIPQRLEEAADRLKLAENVLEDVDRLTKRLRLSPDEIMALASVKALDAISRQAQQGQRQAPPEGGEGGGEGG